MRWRDGAGCRVVGFKGLTMNFRLGSAALHERAELLWNSRYPGTDKCCRNMFKTGRLRSLDEGALK